jgi:hypothetical protein
MRGEHRWTRRSRRYRQGFYNFDMQSYRIRRGPRSTVYPQFVPCLYYPGRPRLSENEPAKMTGSGGNTWTAAQWVYSCEYQHGAGRTSRSAPANRHHEADSRWSGQVRVRNSRGGFFSPSPSAWNSAARSAPPWLDLMRGSVGTNQIHTTPWTVNKSRTTMALILAVHHR